ncbi:Magnesium transport protein CorA [bacterium HR39]|nr:Magnesium transport protein CorA [bacterium HR39]
MGEEAGDDGVVPQVAAGGAASRRRLARDLAAVADRTGVLRGEIGLTLDAAMGFPAYEQNESIRIFTVLALPFMPPTLIASIYGMDFRHMPELEWTYGSPLALLLMLASALFGRWWFRRRGLL